MKMTDLAHDTARRFAAIVAISRQLDLPARPALLDVGGYPCVLGRLLREAHPGAAVLTVDRVEAELADYRVADGAELPFADGEFDAVFSADAFEHIAPERRAQFVAELVRVACGPVVLAAPFNHPAVRAIERQLNDAHLALTGREHPWLHEHVKFGLPDLRETLELFPEGRAVALVRSAPLLDWTLWNWLQMTHELTDSLDRPWEALETALRGLDEQAAMTGAGPDFEVAGAPGERRFLPYRWILVAQPKGAVRLAPPDAFPDPEECQASQCEAYSEMLRATVKAAVSRPSVGGLPPHEEINERLKQALAGAEQQAADLQRELDEIKASRPWTGFLRRWRR